jgi:hypothetical protein
VFQRDEGHDVNDAKTRMDTFVVREVEVSKCTTNQRANVTLEFSCPIDQREDASVMEGVRVQVTK